MSPANKAVAGQLPDDWNRFEQILERFEDAWQKGERPAIDEYLRTSQANRPRLVVELAHADLECRLKAGEAARVESYLDRYAEIAVDREGTLGLIAAEYDLRLRSEPGLSIEEYQRRFPQFRQDLPARLQRPHQLRTPVPSFLSCPH